MSAGQRLLFVVVAAANCSSSPTATTAPASGTPVCAVEQCRNAPGWECGVVLVLVVPPPPVPPPVCVCVRVCVYVIKKLTMTAAVLCDVTLSFGDRNCCGEEDCSRAHRSSYIFFSVHRCKATPCVCPSSAV